jgi:hypothetical protein
MEGGIMQRSAETWDQTDFLARLDAAVESFDRQGATRLGGELAAALAAGAMVEPAAARTILQSLRRKCFFDLMEGAAVALRLAGQDEPRIRRQHAQALIDQGKLTAALDALEALAPRAAGDAAESAEARGLLGRVYKQLYVDAMGGAHGAPADIGAGTLRCALLNLARAVEAYHGVYVTDPERHLWHGINTVALVCRARRDGVPLAAAPDPAELARRILATATAASSRPEAAAWKLATAAEACVALERPTEALLWIGDYVQRLDADAFELASTLRQLREVWQLGISTPPGSLLLPLLEAHLLQRKGGRIDLAPGELGKTIEGSLRVEGQAEEAAGKRLEKVLGADGVVTLKWYQTGLDRCRAVAQVQSRFGAGVGTGFVVRGGDFSAALAGQLLLLTNAHVVSGDPAVQDKYGALDPGDARVAFELPQEAGGDSCRDVRLLWSSRPEELDATLLALDPPLGAADCFPLARRLPAADGRQKVYIIGHAGGRSLSLSLHDNLLLDHDGDRLIHYRAPTEGGSSGSPVFDQQWDLIGLHHGGGLAIDRLRSQPGKYAANEGIWIRRIIQETRAAGLQA